MQCFIIDDDEDDKEIFLMCLHEINKDIRCETMNDCVKQLQC